MSESRCCCNNCGCTHYIHIDSIDESAGAKDKIIKEQDVLIERLKDERETLLKACEYALDKVGEYETLEILKQAITQSKGV